MRSDAEGGGTTICCPRDEVGLADFGSGLPAPILGSMNGAPGRYRTPRSAAAAAGAALGLTLVALSYIPGQPVYPSWLVGVLFVSIFPLFGWAVIDRSIGQARRPRRRWNDFSGISNQDYNRMWAPFLDALKRHKGKLFVAGVVVVGLWAIMMSSILTIQGQPEDDQVGYYLNDHGSRIPVSHAGYEAALAKQDRLFAAGATLFLLVAGALTAYKPRPPIPRESFPG